jgi:hypothetical protein
LLRRNIIATKYARTRPQIYLNLDNFAATHYLRRDLPRRTIAVAGMRRLIMLKAVLRAIVRAYAPGARMLAAMPPSAVRQVLFAI